MAIETIRPIFCVDRPCRELIGSAAAALPSGANATGDGPAQLQLHCSPSLLVTFTEIKAVVAMAMAAGRVARAAAVEPQIQDEFSAAGQSSRGLFAEPPRPYTAITIARTQHLRICHDQRVRQPRERGRRNSHRRQREHSSPALYLEIIFERELHEGLTDFDASETSHPEIELELASSSARSDECNCAICVCQA